MSKIEMPKYIEEKMMLAGSEHGKLIFRIEPYVDAPDNSESFVMGYQHAYVDIIVELGPVIDSLKLIA